MPALTTWWIVDVAMLCSILFLKSVAAYRLPARSGAGKGAHGFCAVAESPFERIGAPNDVIECTIAPRPGIKVGTASEFSLFFHVIPGHADVIREAIQGLQQSPGYRPGDYDLPISSIHEARFVLFDDETRLLFATSFDGAWDAYMDDFAMSPLAGFDAESSNTRWGTTDYLMSLPSRPLCWARRYQLTATLATTPGPSRKSTRQIG